MASGAEHGTGLGLFISKAIVEAHGGTLAGLNNAKGGATFKMILPVENREIADGDNSHENTNNMSAATGQRPTTPLSVNDNKLQGTENMEQQPCKTAQVIRAPAKGIS